MKVAESFIVPAPRASVWSVIENVERVARCLPGVEDVTMADDKAGNRVIDAGNGILGSLRDALKAAARGDAAANDPTDRKARVPLAIAVEASPPMPVGAERRPAASPRLTAAGRTRRPRRSR